MQEETGPKFKNQGLFNSPGFKTPEEILKPGRVRYTEVAVRQNEVIHKRQSKTRQTKPDRGKTEKRGRD